MSKDNGNVLEKEIGSRDQFEERVNRLGLSDDVLTGLYRTMCTIRHFEYMADKLYAMGKVHGTMHLSAGQEAVAAGINLAVCPDDYLINHHRGHGHFIAKGADINLMMAEFLGKETGYNHGRGGSMHIADFQSNNLGANGIVGGGIPQAVGVGLALLVSAVAPLTLVAQQEPSERTPQFVASFRVSADVLGSASAQADRKEPLVAGLLSWVFPGLGNFYAGQAGHGWRHIGIEVVGLGVLIAGAVQNADDPAGEDGAGWPPIPQWTIRLGVTF